MKLDAEHDRREPRRPLGSDVLENAFYRLSVDRATGRVTLFDKALGRDVCRDMEVAALEERGGNYIGIEPPSGRTLFSPVDERGRGGEQRGAGGGADRRPDRRHRDRRSV